MSEYFTNHRSAIIGAGWIGCGYVPPDKYDSSRPSKDNHARAYKHNSKVDLMAIIDKDLDKATVCAKKWRVPVAGSEYWQLPELALDIISICTPPETHCQVLKDIVEHNRDLKAIYCEKPIAIDLDEAREMVAICKERNIILQVNHQRRFGNPTFFYSRGLFDTGTHMIDLLRMYFGEVTKINANRLTFDSGRVIHIHEIHDDSKHIFELTVPTNDLITRGVEHLIYCIEKKKDSISSGEEALKDLEILWKLK